MGAAFGKRTRASADIKADMILISRRLSATRSSVSKAQASIVNDTRELHKLLDEFADARSSEALAIEMDRIGA